MMTREPIKKVVDYSQEHDITIKQRLQELNIPESNFYYAKRMYNRGDMVPGVDGCFIQLFNGAAVPNTMPQYASRKSKGKEPQMESYMTVELRIGPDTAMRLQGSNDSRASPSHYVWSDEPCITWTKECGTGYSRSLPICARASICSRESSTTRCPLTCAMGMCLSSSIRTVTESSCCGRRPVGWSSMR